MKKKSLLFCLLFLGCSQSEVLLFSSIPEEGWIQHEWVDFRYSNRLPSKDVAVSWKIRHDNDYPYANIHLIARCTNPKGMTTIDTLTYLMATPSGSWLGKGWYIKEIDLLYKEKLSLDEPGEYLFELRPAVRANDAIVPDKKLLGIHQIGLELNLISYAQ
ncbi:MAG: gliding motility lipoprotein GldH [Flavobacteriaceae bacterium]